MSFKYKLAAALISLPIFFSVFFFPCLLIRASAEGVSDDWISRLASVQYSNWSELPDDFKNLGEAYVNAFKSIGSKDFFDSAADVPISWYHILDDTTPVLSIGGAVFYYLDSNGNLKYTKKGSSGSGNSIEDNATLVNSRDKLAVDGNILNKAITTANKHYSPKNCRQYISFRTSDYSPSILLYSSGVYPNCFFEQGWRDGCYYTPFYFDGTDYYYTPFVYHDYLKLNDDGVTEYHSDVEDMRDPSRGLDARVFTNQYLKSGSYVAISPFTTQLSCYAVYQNFENFLNNRGWILSTGNTFGSGANTYTYYLDGKMSNPVTVFPHFDFSKLSPSVFDEKYPDFVNCDVGFFISNEPIEFQYTIDTTKIPDNYYITVGGDTIYDYNITNPVTGDTTTINNYITNNYTFITNPDNPGNPGSGSTINNYYDGAIINNGDNHYYDGATINNGDNITNNYNFSEGDTNFFTQIGVEIQNALNFAFVPSDSYMDKFNVDLRSTLESKIPFVYDIGDIFDSLFVEIVDNNLVYVSDVNSDGSVDESSIIYPKWTFNVNFFGTDYELVYLDFSMYSESFFYIRLVVACFTYLGFFVMLLRSLPGIIGNIGDLVGASYSIAPYAIERFSDIKGGD